MSELAGGADVQTHELFWFCTTCSVCVGFGVLIAVCSLYYVCKTRTEPKTLLTALGGGFLGSASLASISAAIGTGIKGLPFPMTWGQAGVLTAVGFLLGTTASVIVGMLYVRLGIIKPVTKRFGALHGAMGWLTLVAGSDPFGSWLQQIHKAVDMDEAWDEFSEAAVDFFHRLDTEDGRLGDVSAGVTSSRPRTKIEIVLRTLESAKTRSESRRGDDNEVRRAMIVVQPILTSLVETLTSRLRRNSLNFTVWRVHPSQDELEHITSFPFGRRNARKEPLPIWSDRNRIRTASCAAEAMLCQKYIILNEETIKNQKWERRRLGAKYSQVGCMPIPCDGDKPWGVLCAEIREGHLPLTSEVMIRILRELSDLLNQVARIARSRTIEATRLDDEPSESSPRREHQRAEDGESPREVLTEEG